MFGKHLERLSGKANMHLELEEVDEQLAAFLIYWSKLSAFVARPAEEQTDRPPTRECSQILSNIENALYSQSDEDLSSKVHHTN